MTPRETTAVLLAGAGGVFYLLMHRRSSAPAAIAGGTAPRQGPLSPTPWDVTGRPGGPPMPQSVAHLWNDPSSGGLFIVAGTGDTAGDVDALGSMYGIPVVGGPSS